LEGISLSATCATGPVEALFRKVFWSPGRGFQQLTLLNPRPSTMGIQKA